MTTNPTAATIEIVRGSTSTKTAKAGAVFMVRVRNSGGAMVLHANMTETQAEDYAAQLSAILAS